MVDGGALACTPGVSNSYQRQVSPAFAQKINWKFSSNEHRLYFHICSTIQRFNKNSSFQSCFFLPFTGVQVCFTSEVKSFRCLDNGGLKLFEYCLTIQKWIQKRVQRCFTKTMPCCLVGTGSALQLNSEISRQKFGDDQLSIFYFRC